MNRQERRRLLKEGHSNQAVQNQYNIEAYDKGKRDGIREVYRHILIITAYIARINFGLGKKRLNEFMTRLEECLKSFATGQLSNSDIHEIIQECKKYGYDIFSKERN